MDFLRRFGVFCAALLFSVSVFANTCPICAGIDSGSCPYCSGEMVGEYGSTYEPLSGHNLWGTGMTVDGYINAGGNFNDHGATYNFNSANSDNKLGLNGAYGSLSKKARIGCGVMDWGFGADAIFGRDARILQGTVGFDSDWVTGHRSDDLNGYNKLPFDNRDYGFAIPQLYMEGTINRVGIKTGRFYTLMGYESSRADERFFNDFGRSYEMTPKTYTGILGTYQIGPHFEISTGWAMGEDTCLKRENNSSVLIGQVKLFTTNEMFLKYDYVVGDSTLQGDDGKIFRNDVVFSRKLTSRLEGAALWNYGQFVGEGNPNYNFTADMNSLMLFENLTNLRYQTYGGYLFYTLNQNWKVGSRTEWQRGWANGSALETYEFTFGANWHPAGRQNLFVRPEIRYDSSPDAIFGKIDNRKSDQITLGFDVLYEI